MHLQRFDDIHAFYTIAEPFLLQHEAENNLPLGICSNLLNNPQQIPEDAYLAIIENDGKPLMIGLRTPPFNLVISHIAAPDTPEIAAALDILVEDVYDRYGELPGIHTTKPTGKQFADRWSARTGCRLRMEMAQRIYELTEVIPVKAVAGTMRTVVEADRDLLYQWTRGFMTDAMDKTHPSDEARIEAITNDYLNPQRAVAVFWEVDGEPVSMAGYTGRTPNGIRVTLVYTPPEHRKHGYASACVAKLSQYLLDQGHRFCFLFTDLENPTSNHIYQAMGYRPICDVDVYSFES